MNKMMILGIYDFIGYGLCTRLLSEGIEVDGYRFFSDGQEEYMEEKKLLIGRNANFEEKLLDEEVDDLGNIHKATAVISFYDLFFSVKASPSGQLFENINNCLNKHVPKSIALLLPLKFLTMIPEGFKEFLTSLDSYDIPIQMIYLPTIYGPWQPATFLYQQYIMKNQSRTTPKLDERESTLDALFLEDVLDELLMLLFSNTSNQILLKSEDQNQWYKGAEYLHIAGVDKLSNSEAKYVNQLSENLVIKTVHSKVSIDKGLNQQKQNYLRLIDQLS
jgi:hypothetical protein